MRKCKKLSQQRFFDHIYDVIQDHINICISNVKGRLQLLILYGVKLKTQLYNIAFFYTLEDLFKQLFSYGCQRRDFNIDSIVSIMVSKVILSNTTGFNKSHPRQSCGKIAYDSIGGNVTNKNIQLQFQIALVINGDQICNKLYKQVYQMFQILLFNFSEV